jgi:hypothetical protein
MSTGGDNVGVHDNSRGWIWYWNGTYTSFDFGYTQFAGSARAPLFYDSGNTSFYLAPSGTSVLNALNITTINGRSANTLFYYQGFTLDANTMDTNASGFTYGVNAPYVGPIMRVGETGYSLQFNAPYSGNGYGLAFRTRNGDAGSFNSWRFPAVYGVNINGGGDLYATTYYDNNNTAYYFDGSATGDSIRVAGDVVAYYSDERLKDRKGNIENALEKILSLDGFYYEANELAQSLGYEKKLEVGLSAQQVEAVLPEIIKAAPVSKEYKTLNYGRLMPLVVEAMKEQNLIIKKQQTQIEELKQLVNKLINK